MSMKQKINSILSGLGFISGVLVLVWLTSCKSDTSKKEGPDGDTMSHSGMDGMKMDHSAHETDKKNQSAIDTIVLPVNYSVVSLQKTIKPMFIQGEMGWITTDGIVELDLRRSKSVSSRISGRIERLYTKFNFAYVKKGEKIMDIYSPELNTYQEELLYLLKDKSEQTLILKAKEKLKLLGLSDNQIAQLETERKIMRTVSIYSAYEGYILFGDREMSRGQDSERPSAGGGMQSMGNIPKTQATTDVGTAKSQIREGDYITRGQSLFLLNDLRTVWAVYYIDNVSESTLKVRTPIYVTSDHNKSDTLLSHINFIEPVIRSGKKFIRIRVDLDNTKMLYKPNDILTGSIRQQTGKYALVPYSSILFLGKRKIVWVKTNDYGNGKAVFTAREVTTGVDFNSNIEITSGLSLNEEIAVDAGFMIDSEGLVQPQ